MGVSDCCLEQQNKKPATAEAARARKIATGFASDHAVGAGSRGSRVLPRDQDSGTTQRRPFYEELPQCSVGIVRLYVWIRRGIYEARVQALVPPFG
jgi:hypothetical protein